jgi:16S rRNA (guanine966-N2)-methyltransferase
MRVIAGERGGFKLKGSPGPGTRPMTDKIKGALFSMLGSLGVEPETVLDLYAGTGGLGIEALSRGASSADFVEQQPAAVAVIRHNLAHTKYEEVGRVHLTSVAAFIGRGTGPYDLIIMDPPYADPEIVPTLERVGRSSLVQSGTIVAVGHSPRVALPDEVGRLARLRLRCHGDSCFSVYEANGDRAGSEDAGSDDAGDLPG